MLEEIRENFREGNTMEKATKERIQCLWGRVREIYKPKTTQDSFYQLYQAVMKHRSKCIADNLAGLGQPQEGGEEEDPEEEEEEEYTQKVDETTNLEEKNKVAKLKKRCTLVNRQKIYAVMRLKRVAPEKWTKKVRQIQGEELACLLTQWMQRVEICLRRLAAKICVLGKSENDLIGELSRLVMIALLTREWNEASWPKLRDWRFSLRKDGTASQPNICWTALKDHKLDMMTDIRDPELHRLMYCRSTSQRQLLFRHMHLFFCERLRSISSDEPPCPSNFNQYKSIQVLFDLDNLERYWKLNSDQDIEEAEALAKKREDEEKVLRILQEQTLAENSLKKLDNFPPRVVFCPSVFQFQDHSFDREMQNESSSRVSSPKKRIVSSLPSSPKSILPPLQFHFVGHNSHYSSDRKASEDSGHQQEVSPRGSLLPVLQNKRTDHPHAHYSSVSFAKDSSPTIRVDYLTNRGRSISLENIKQGSCNLVSSAPPSPRSTPSPGPHSHISSRWNGTISQKRNARTLSLSRSMLALSGRDATDVGINRSMMIATENRSSGGNGNQSPKRSMKGFASSSHLVDEAIANGSREKSPEVLAPLNPRKKGDQIPEVRYFRSAPKVTPVVIWA